MKRVHIIAGLFLLVTVFAACSKDDSTSPAPLPAGSGAFIGKWTGNYGFDSETPAIYFALNIKADGVIQELNSSGVAKGEGSWTMQGNVLKGTYTMKFSPYNKYSVQAVVNSSTGKIEGTWGYDNDGTDGGKILLTKQQ